MYPWFIAIHGYAVMRNCTHASFDGFTVETAGNRIIQFSSV